MVNCTQARDPVPVPTQNPSSAGMESTRRLQPTTVRPCKATREPDRQLTLSLSPVMIVVSLRQLGDELGSVRIEAQGPQGRGRALLDVIDETVTGMGSRMLRSWLLRPSIRRGEIEASNVDRFGVVVRADAPWKTFPEFLDYAKKNPGRVKMGHAGVGLCSGEEVDCLSEQGQREQRRERPPPLHDGFAQRGAVVAGKEVTGRAECELTPLVAGR